VKTKTVRMKMPLWHNRHVDRSEVNSDALRDRKTTRDTKKTDRVIKREPQMERKPFEKGKDNA